MGSTSTDPVDFDNVQGDILTGLPKKTQSFIFFDIVNVAQFQDQLQYLIPLISSTSDITSDRKRIQEHKARHNAGLVEMSHINIAFSQAGLIALGITDELGDAGFAAGMKNEITALGDDITNWHSQFKDEKHPIHGVIMVTGSDETIRNGVVANVYQIFQVGDSEAGFCLVLQLDGKVRPGVEDGHEHFGFNDGLSQPAIQGVDTPVPGQETVRQGIVLLNREGDTVSRPDWAQDGSFLAFRYLQQLVPEFNNFLSKNALPGADPDLLGARLVGRWKSGASVFMTPDIDNPELAKPAFNQDFRYESSNQDACPYAAHTRKTNPRADLDFVPGPQPTEIRRVLRRGIQFGPEVTAEEAISNTSSPSPDKERGLLFVAYQSNLANGFQFIQKSWANIPGFPPRKVDSNNNPVTPGFDAIIGQDTAAAAPLTREKNGMVGSDPSAEATSLKLPNEWVVARGGEYFISPSISALQNTFAKPAAQMEL